MKTKRELAERITATAARSKWTQGVKLYALDLIEDLETYPDGDIAARLCTPSELKRTKCGQLNPNSREDWADIQARALYQAAKLIISLL